MTVETLKPWQIHAGALALLLAMGLVSSYAGERPEERTWSVEPSDRSGASDLERIASGSPTPSSRKSRSRTPRWTTDV